MQDLLVLCYHGISDTWPAGESVTRRHLERQLKAFLRRGYRPATLSAALAAEPTGKSLVVTFDDAHRSVGAIAAPLMAQLGVPGTVYVPTGFAGTDEPMAWDGYDLWRGTEHEEELLCMGWRELRALASAGWEVGSHTRSHPRLSQLDDAGIAAELAQSKRDCEENLDRPCESLAYPYSDYDTRAVRAAGDAGYRFAVTVPRGPAVPRPLEWPRVGVYREEGARRVILRAWSRRRGGSRLRRSALALRRLSR